MGLPDSLPVKISSEAAGYVSLTAVVTQQMPVRELVETMMAVTGRDAERIRELLRRGSLVSGASRFRWNGVEAAPGDVEALLATLPGPEPSRPFAPNACTRAVLRGAGVRIEIPRDAAAQKRMFRGETFWDVLSAAARENPPEYVEYSYGERADRYTARLPAGAPARIAEAAALLKFRALEAQVRRGGFDSIEFLVPR